MVGNIRQKITSQPRWRLAWMAAVLILAGWFLYLKVVPGGQIEYRRTWPRGWASGQGFIYDFKPGERLAASDRQSLQIIGDPVYFSLFAPRSFSKAEVTVRYRAALSEKTPLIEVGVLKNKLTGAYDLQPLENRRLAELTAGWHKVERREPSGQHLVLYQADENYQTVEEFVADLEKGRLRACPANTVRCLATYNYPWTAPFKLADKVQISPLMIDQAFRCAHQVYVYLPAGAWELSFDFQDLNLDAAPDPITITVLDERGRPTNHEVADDYQQPPSGQSQARRLDISGQSENGGLYKVQIKVSDDIVVTQLEGSSNYLSFINKFWPVSSSGPIKLYTDSSHLQVKTFNPASLGPVAFGGETSLIDETYRQFDLRRSGFSRQISLEKSDLILENNGVFSFDPDILVNPNPDRLDRFFIARPEVIYFLARYQEPTEAEGVKEAKAILDLSGAPREQGRYGFLLSVPGLGADTPGSVLEIEELKIRLSGRSLWQKISTWISR